MVVIVEVSISRQMGQVSSDWRSLGEIVISVLSVIASCGVLCSSYSERSQFFPESSVMVSYGHFLGLKMLDWYNSGF